MKEIHWLTARQISENYGLRKLSPVEVTSALLKRIKELDSKINSFIFLDEESAMNSAREAEKEISSGKFRGSLHGIPIAIKDNINMVGLATTCHSKILVDNIAIRDARIISQLRSSGAILIGKLALHEFAFGGPTFDGPFPPARNPWNTDHHPGGSSSGSGAALGAGFVPITIGTDTAGSIRNPAGACGVAGLKPTYDLVSRNGVFPLAYTVEHVGPMARSINDIALTMDSIACKETMNVERYTTENLSYTNDLNHGVKGLRIGFVRHFHESDLIADPEVIASLNEVAGVLKDLGASIEDVVLPSLQEMQSVEGIIWYSETWAIHKKWLRERPEDYTQAARKKLMRGAFLSAGDYVNAQQCRKIMTDSVNQVFQDFDVLITASSFDPICRIDETEIYARNYARQGRSPFNMTGHPALAMMSGICKRGLPLSVQFVGRHFDEKKLFRVAAAYESATPWHHKHPQI